MLKVYIFMALAILIRSREQMNMKAFSNEMHDYINSIQSEWRAGDNFKEEDLQRVKRLCGTRLKKPSKLGRKLFENIQL